MNYGIPDTRTRMAGAQAAGPYRGGAAEFADVAAYALPEVRARFIRKTYTHLAGAVLAFIVLEYALLNTPGVEAVVGLLLQSWLVTLGAFMGVSWLADRWASSKVSRRMQYVGLGAYIVAEAVIFLPLMYIAAYYSDPSVIPAAGIITGLLFAGLTAVAFTSGVDFSFLRGALILGGFLALGLIVAALLLGFTLGVVFSAAMIALAAGYILYTTSNVLRRYNTEQYVAASLSLFASVALMFYYVLMVLVRR